MFLLKSLHKYGGAFFSTLSDTGWQNIIHKSWGHDNAKAKLFISHMEMKMLRKSFLIAKFRKYGTSAQSSWKQEVDNYVQSQNVSLDMLRVSLLVIYLWYVRPLCDYDLFLAKEGFVLQILRVFRFFGFVHATLQWHLLSAKMIDKGKHVTSMSREMGALRHVTWVVCALHGVALVILQQFRPNAVTLWC